MRGSRLPRQARARGRAAVRADDPCGAARSLGAAVLTMLASAPVMAQEAAEGARADYSHWGVNALVVLATAVAVCACVMLHYEVLNVLSRWLAHRRGQRRQRVLFAIVGMLSAHIAEIWIFAFASMLLLLGAQFGVTAGIDSDLLDQVYLSAMTFTTVGVGDAHVAGPIRFLNGTEALTGLVLITWSASFTFLEMERFWRDR
jgi:ion channel